MVFYGSARLPFRRKGERSPGAYRCGDSLSSIGRTVQTSAWRPHQHQHLNLPAPVTLRHPHGYQNLCQLITQFKMREPTKAKGAANRR